MWLIYWFGQARTKFIAAENHKFNETNSKTSLQSSFNSHPLWITLNIMIYWTYINKSVSSILIYISGLSVCPVYYYSIDDKTT